MDKIQNQMCIYMFTLYLIQTKYAFTFSFDLFFVMKGTDLKLKLDSMKWIQKARLQGEGKCLMCVSEQKFRR